MTTTEHYFGPGNRPVAVGDIVHLPGALTLESGVVAHGIPMAYQVYGTLNADRSNAILLCHGLTGDQYAASTHPVTGKPGWWEFMIGPGRALDTSRYAVVCANIIGGCMGSWGPKSTNPATGRPYELDFPVVTVGDMVAAQARLLDALGIDRLHATIGISMGGMLALQWLARHPQRAGSVAVIASAARHTAQNIAFHEIGRQAIMADPDWRGGRYLTAGTYPANGLAVARMTAHVTYLSECGLQEKFGRRLQDRAALSYGFEADFQVESYLRYQGRAFVERFDPNAYLYITRAMDYFDLAAETNPTDAGRTDTGRGLAEAFRACRNRVCIIAFTSDWLYPPEESRRIVRALSANGASVSYVVVPSDKGHDAILLPDPAYEQVLAGFLGLRSGVSTP